MTAPKQAFRNNFSDSLPSVASIRIDEAPLQMLRYIALFLSFLASGVAIAADLPQYDKAKADAEFWAEQNRQERERVKKLHEAISKMPNKHYSSSSGGCGSRGGPGWRKADGKCASWRD